MIFRRKPKPAADATPRQRMTRRRFLKTSGALGVGLVVLWGGGSVALDRLRRSLPENVPTLDGEPNAWLRVGPDGRVRLLINKMEMGQGIQSAALQIVAEELDVPVEQIDLDTADTNALLADSFGTAGSLSVMTLYPALRTAAATARGAILELAAAQTKRPIAELSTAAGFVVSAADPALRLGYGALVAGQRLIRKASGDVPLKARESFKVIGQSTPRRDIPDKVTGKAKYAYDIKVENMAHGRVARPPMIGAVATGANLAAARALPGVIAAIQTATLIGVVAETPQQASAALNALDVTWQLPAQPLQQSDIEALLVPSADATVLRDVGDAAAALDRAAQRVQATYRTAMATHTPMEPQAAVADVRPDGATIWAATQAPFSLRGQVAKLTGLKDAQVNVVPTLIGGGFGRKSVSTAAHEATQLSQAAGRPVRVAWNRAEEFTAGFVRPPTVTTLAGIVSGGKVAAWSQQLATGFVLFSFFPAALRLVFGSDFGATRGAVGLYEFPNHHVAATVTELPVKTGPWRGLGVGPNGFAVEQFMDELAVAAGADPLAFRLAHLPTTDPASRTARLAGVLSAVARSADWGSPLPTNAGRGIACGFDGGTCVAEVAEVTVDRATGAVRVVRMFAAVDCGLAINPKNVEAQTEGGMLMALSSALKEEMVVKDGQWVAQSFAQYPIARMDEAPVMRVEVLDRSDLPPGGMGEPPVLPAAAAIGNAIYAAVGARVRTMPMTPERVLAALATR